MKTMAVERTIEYADGVTEICFSANPSYTDILAAIDDLVENYPYEKRLWDFSSIDFDLSMDKLRSLATYGKSVFGRPNDMAVVVPQDHAFGEIRAFEVYREQEGHCRARAFRTKDQALKWLTGGE